MSSFRPRGAFLAAVLSFFSVAIRTAKAFAAAEPIVVIPREGPGKLEVARHQHTPCSENDRSCSVEGVGARSWSARVVAAARNDYFSLWHVKGSSTRQSMVANCPAARRLTSRVVKVAHALDDARRKRRRISRIWRIRAIPDACWCANVRLVWPRRQLRCAAHVEPSDRRAHQGGVPPGATDLPPARTWTWPRHGYSRSPRSPTRHLAEIPPVSASSTQTT